MDYRQDIAVCPRCKKVPSIRLGMAIVHTTDLQIDTYHISCCELDGRTWISKSYAILHWNLKALNLNSKIWQPEFSFV